MGASNSSVPLDSLWARWREAERRLYPLVLSSPELYEYSLKLVRAVADELRAVKTPEELATMFDRREQLFSRAAAAVGAGGPVDTDAVSGAAFSLRYAELETQATRAVARERIAEARRDGRPWAMLYESGSRTFEGAPMPPYHLLEACLERPWGLHASVTFDMDANVVVYSIEVVRVDLESTEWWADDAAPAGERTHTDMDSWRASLAELRELLLQTPVQT